jgi:hypothetical protein
VRHTKREVLARTRREFVILDRLVARLGPADWKRRAPRPPGREPWTVKDALAHILYWKEHSARVFRGERRLPEMRGLAGYTEKCSRRSERIHRRGSAGASAHRRGRSISTAIRPIIAGSTSRPCCRR